MVLRLDSADARFAAAFDDLLAQRREDAAAVDDTVRDILDNVRARGDAALVEYTARFDRLELAPEALRLTEDEIEEAAAAVPSDVADALQLAHDRIAAHHARQLPEDSPAFLLRLGYSVLPHVTI